MLFPQPPPSAHNHSYWSHRWTNQGHKATLTDVAYLKRQGLHLWPFASFALTVGHEAREERQVNAVMQCQKEVTRQLEVRGILGQQLPDTVQEEQENRSLREQRQIQERINRPRGIKMDWKQPNHNETQSYRKRQHSPPPCHCRGGSSCGCRSGDPPSPTPFAPGPGSRAVSGTADHTSPAQGWKPRSSCPDRLLL